MRSVLAILWLSASLAHADVQVSDAWARASMPGQAVGGVFLRLSSAEAATVVGVKCECAERAEIHQTIESKGVARMRQQKTVILAPGKTVEFKPGGLHIMLLGLKAPLKVGDEHRLSLTIQQGAKRSALAVPFTVRAQDGAAGEDHSHHHH